MPRPSTSLVVVVLDGVVQRVEESLIGARILNDQLGLSVDRENLRPAGLLQAPDVLSRIPPEITKRHDVLDLDDGALLLAVD